MAVIIMCSDDLDLEMSDDLDLEMSDDLVMSLTLLLLRTTSFVL
jgi:hypothetical protein